MSTIKGLSCPHATGMRGVEGSPGKNVCIMDDYCVDDVNIVVKIITTMQSHVFRTDVYKLKKISDINFGYYSHPLKGSYKYSK